MRIFTAMVTLAVLWGWGAPLPGNEIPDNGTPTEASSVSDVQPVDSLMGTLQRRFEANSPPIGAALPDVVALDIDGNEFRLSELKGQYSVIVSGCLT